jgi:outer membrane protein OmpA-like peptidoglycan-associated protein
MHRHTGSSSWLVIAAALLLAAPVARAESQGFGERLKRAAGEAAKRTVEQRVETKTEEATGATLDRAEEGAKSGAKAGANAAASGAAAERPEQRDASAPRSGSAASSSATGASTATSVPVRTNTGQDFTPGTRVLVATDFGRDEIGDFPRSFRLRNGNVEVADVGGTRYLRATSHGELSIPLPETLPEMFTMELDFAGGDGYYQAIYFSAADDVDRVEFRPSDGGLMSEAEGASFTALRGTSEGRPFRVQIMADGDYLKVYLNGTRVTNMPNTALGRSRAVRIRFRGEPERPTLFGNIRIAAGGKDLYKALAERGRVTAEGIFFDTNSDRLRAESEPALREIAELLTQHGELRLAIEGHTDNVGSAAANLTLSEKRAAAVRAHLGTKYGIPASRLEPRGLGSTKPAASNDSEAGRQKNRRVELVRL